MPALYTAHVHMPPRCCGSCSKSSTILQTLRRYWFDMQSSFWFVPTLLVSLAVLLAMLLVEVDTRLPPEALQSWRRIFGASPDGSRLLLSTVAGSMITVAGVVFSITLVALSLAASQYTSRVLRTFMRNRVTQVVLGTFVGIYAYCLLVLRTIRGADGDTGFVPSLAVLMGLALAFLGIGLLIFFIHHIARSIQAAQILAQIEAETIATVNEVFPHRTEQEEAEDCPPDADPPGRCWHPVPAAASGYLRQIATDDLLAFAQAHDLMVRLEIGVGGFTIRDLPVAWVLSCALPDPKQLHQIQMFCRSGRQRTMHQDVAFGLRQMVDVALKALSPGINDSTTAVMSVDHLSAVLARLSDRQIATRYRSDDGQIRLWLCGPNYAGLVGEAFDQIRRNAAGNMTLITHLLQALERLASVTTIAQRRQVLLAQAQAVAEVGRRSIEGDTDSQDLDEIATRVLGILQ